MEIGEEEQENVELPVPVHPDEIPAETPPEPAREPEPEPVPEQVRV